MAIIAGNVVVARRLEGQVFQDHYITCAERRSGPLALHREMFAPEKPRPS